MNKYRYPEILHVIYDRLVPLRHVLPWFRYPLKRKNEEITPFFIIGSGRSGTTLLRRILIQVKGVHIPPETYVLGKVIKLYRQNAGMAWDDLITLILSTIEYHDQFYTFNLTRLDELSRNLIELPEEERSLARILDSFYKYHAASQGIDCRIWGDKTPLNTLSIKRISKLFPNAKYVYLTRDPYDVVYSYVHNDLYENVVDAAKRWTLSNRKAFSLMKRNPRQVLKVRYEDMVTNPDVTIKQIFDFLGFPYREDFLQGINNDESHDMGDVEQNEHHYNIYKNITNRSVGKGSEHLNEKEKARILPIVDEMKHKIGY